MGFLYLAALLVSITGMILLDRRHTLFFWQDARRATVVLAPVLVFFLRWDLVGLDAVVFFRGEGPWMTGILLAPELPLEEVFFLALLCYMTMNVFSAFTKVVKK